MKWLWRKEAHQPQIDTKGDLGGDLTLLNLLILGQSWEVAADNLGFADALCADVEGNVYFSDMKAPAIYRIGAGDGQRTEIVQEAVSGLKFGPDGLLYGCQGAKNRVISIDVKTAAVNVVAGGVTPNDLAVTADGLIFITETKAQQVTRIHIKSGEVTPVDMGITKPNGIALTQDGGTLAVSDYGGDSVWMFRVNPDGTFDGKLPTMPLRLPINYDGEFNFNEPPLYLTASLGDGMAVDKKGRFYVTSALGIQIFDPTGRPCGVLPKPNPDQPLTTCTLGGADHSTLYIANGTTIYSRQLTVEHP
jgi:enterochelin esterase family protein